MRRGRVPLLNLAVYAFVILAIGLMIINRLDGDIHALEDVKANVNLTLLDMQREKSANIDEISRKDTEKYIVEIARSEYGYMYKGEIRYEITNKEMLYD